MNRIKPDLINIFHIIIHKSVVNTTAEYVNSPIVPANLRFGFSQNTSFNFDKKNVRIRLDVLIDGVDEKENIIGLHGEFGIEFHLHVENLEDFIEVKDNKQKVSGVLGLSLLGIIYSTARGIILDRTQGTYLNGIIIPIIDPHELIKAKPV